MINLIFTTAFLLFVSLISTAHANISDDRKISLSECNQKFAKNWKSVEQKKDSKFVFTTFAQKSKANLKSVDIKFYLPFEELFSSSISQAPGGAFSHNIRGFEDSIDFIASICTPVVAVAPGRVIDVYVESDAGGLSPQDVEKNNYIRIDHGGGFFQIMSIFVKNVHLSNVEILLIKVR